MARRYRESCAAVTDHRSPVDATSGSPDSWKGMGGVTYKVIDVSEWPAVAEEPLGADAKEWICPPERVAVSGDREHLWLYKPAKSGIRKIKGGSQRSFRRMDDLAERIVCELARLVGIPVTEVELAERITSEGMISRNVTPNCWEFHSADVVLSELPGYESCAGEERPRHRVGHTLENIRAILRDCGGPPGACGEWQAFDVFVGFLMLDAWVANTDRHAFNWAVLERGSERRLAASFDHGSSLASGQPDEDLDGQDPAAFARRGIVTRFEAPPRTTLVEFAHQAESMTTGRGREWRERIAGVNVDDIGGILDAMPRLSVARRRFLIEVLEENQRRLKQ